MRFHHFLLIFLLLAIGVATTGCSLVKKTKFQTGGSVQTKTKKISAEEERAIMEQTNKLFAVGLEAEQQNDLQAAEWAYLECLQFNEKRGSVKYVGPPYHRLAVIAARQGKMGKSEEYFRKALEHGTENVELACDFAQMLLDTNREYEATVVLENALITFPQDKKLLFFLGHTLAIQDREIEALRRLKGSIGEAAAYHEIAQILREKGNSDGAGLMDQKGLLAQQDHRRSLDKLERLGKEENLQQELIDERAMALLTYSSKTPKLGSINRRYSEVLGDQTSGRSNYREQLAQTPRINPAEVMIKYGRPRFSESSDAMFPTLPSSGEYVGETSGVASSSSAPMPQASVKNTPTNAPALPTPPSVMPNQRVATRPDRTVVFPPKMSIHQEDGESIIATSEFPVDPQLIREPNLQYQAETSGEPQRLAARDVSQPTRMTSALPTETSLDLEPAPATWETDEVNIIQEPPSQFEDDFRPTTSVLPVLEPRVEKSITQTAGLPSFELAFENSSPFTELTLTGIPKIATAPTSQFAAIVPFESEVPRGTGREEPVSMVSALMAEPPTITKGTSETQTPFSMVFSQEELDWETFPAKKITLSPVKPRAALKMDAELIQLVQADPEFPGKIESPSPRTSLGIQAKFYTPVQESLQVSLRQSDESTVNSKDDNKTLAFGSQTVSLKSSEPASEIVLKSGEKTDTEAAPKRLMRVQSESDIPEAPKSLRL